MTENNEPRQTLVFLQAKMVDLLHLGPHELYSDLAEMLDKVKVALAAMKPESKGEIERVLSLRPNEVNAALARALRIEPDVLPRWTASLDECAGLWPEIEKLGLVGVYIEVLERLARPGWHKWVCVTATPGQHARAALVALTRKEMA